MLRCWICIQILFRRGFSRQYYGAVWGLDSDHQTSSA